MLLTSRGNPLLLWKELSHPPQSLFLTLSFSFSLFSTFLSSSVFTSQFLHHNKFPSSFNTQAVHVTALFSFSPNHLFLSIYSHGTQCFLLAHSTSAHFFSNYTPVFGVYQIVWRIISCSKPNMLTKLILESFNCRLICFIYKIHILQQTGRISTLNLRRYFYCHLWKQLLNLAPHSALEVISHYLS